MAPSQTARISAPAPRPTSQNKLLENLNASLHKGFMNRMEYGSIHEVVGRVKVCVCICVYMVGLCVYTIFCRTLSSNHFVFRFHCFHCIC